MIKSRDWDRLASQQRNRLDVSDALTSAVRRQRQGPFVTLWLGQYSSGPDTLLHSSYSTCLSARFLFIPMATLLDLPGFGVPWLTFNKQNYFKKNHKIIIIMMITRVKVFKENQKQPGKDASLWNDPGRPNCFHIYSQLNKWCWWCSTNHSAHTWTFIS